MAKIAVKLKDEIMHIRKYAQKITKIVVNHVCELPPQQTFAIQ